MAFGTPSSVEFNISAPTWTKEGGGSTGAGVYYTDLSAAIPSLGTNRVGVVLISCQLDPFNLTSWASVDWNSTSMTARSAVTNTGATSQAFYWIGADHNGTYTIRLRGNFSDTASSGLGLITVGWVDNDADAILYDNEDTSSGSAEAAAVVDVPISAAGIVFSTSGHNANALTSLTGCTELQSWDSGGNCFYSAYSAPGSAATVTHTHTYSQTGLWHAVGLSFVADGGGGGGFQAAWARGANVILGVKTQ